MPDNDERQQAALQLAHAQLMQDAATFNKLGQDELGPDYDDSLKTVVTALGDDQACNEVAAFLREANAPHPSDAVQATCVSTSDTLYIDTQ
jgi:hypothetical protein